MVKLGQSEEVTRRRRAFAIALTALAAAGTASAAPPVLSATDKAAAFRAAGFKPKGREWVRCEDETASAQTGFIEAADLNGDGAPEAWVRESSTFCYGNTAEAFVLVTKQAAGWSVLLDEVEWRWNARRSGEAGPTSRSAARAAVLSPCSATTARSTCGPAEPRVEIARLDPQIHPIRGPAPLAGRARG